MKPVEIYGIFFNRFCLYIGRSFSSSRRFSAHKTYQRLWRDKRVTCRVLRHTTVNNVARIEAQVIAAFKRKGQAKANKIKFQCCTWAQ